MDIYQGIIKGIKYTCILSVKHFVLAFCSCTEKFNFLLKSE